VPQRQGDRRSPGSAEALPCPRRRLGRAHARSAQYCLLGTEGKDRALCPIAAPHPGAAQVAPTPLSRDARVAARLRQELPTRVPLPRHTEHSPWATTGPTSSPMVPQPSQDTPATALSRGRPGAAHCRVTRVHRTARALPGVCAPRGSVCTAAVRRSAAPRPGRRGRAALAAVAAGQPLALPAAGARGDQPLPRSSRTAGSGSNSPAVPEGAG